MIYKLFLFSCFFRVFYHIFFTPHDAIVWIIERTQYSRRLVW